MMTSDVKKSANLNVDSRHPLSWIDRLIRWIDRLPGPAWLFYLVGILAITLLINVVLWIDGSTAFGSYGSFQGIFPPFVLYFLALYHYLTRAGSRSLLEYRPLIEVDEAEFTRIDRELGTLPPQLGWLGIVAAIISLPNFFLSGQAFGIHEPNTVLPYVVAGVAAVFFGSTIFCLFLRSIRQLRLVHKLHARATNISLLELEPAHAFSGLTARTGAGIILLLMLGYIRDPSLVSGVWVYSYLIMAAAAIGIFIVPILGMRDRLAQEKAHVLSVTSDLLQLTSDKLEERIRADDYANLQGMETAIRALIRKREMVEKISTWPWNPGTIRGFASTLLLPIFLWLATRLLGRFF
jgi:hypothetical protein